MSRTDKTKPLWVRCAEHHPRPAHDHRYGTCDLPPAPTREDPDTRCRWTHSAFGESCCSGPHGRAASKERREMATAGNRADRYAGRLDARRSAAGAYSG